MDIQRPGLIRSSCASQQTTRTGLSRTQSILSEVESTASTQLGSLTLRRTLSLPMPTNQCPTSSQTLNVKRSNFSIQLPSFNWPGLSLGRNNNNETEAALDPPTTSTTTPLPPFISAPLTPPEEHTILELGMNLSPSCENPARERTALSLPPSNMSTPSIYVSERPDTSTMTTTSVFAAAAATAVSSLEPVINSHGSVKIVHMPLPVPLLEHSSNLDREAGKSDLLSDASAYPQLINALRSNPVGQAAYLHTVQVLLTRQTSGTPQPISPAASPALQHGGSERQSYFELETQNACFLPDPYPFSRDDKNKPAAPVSPFRACPPRDASLSLYERIIPPTTRNEVLDLLEPHGNSPLLQRIKELSLNGALMVVYPTQAGGRAFEREYLGPVLDPVLRGIIEEFGMRVDLAEALAPMVAIQDLLPFDQMKSKMELLIEELNRDGSDNGTESLSVVHASNAKVQVTKKAWLEWWLIQEMPRIKARLLEYYRAGHLLPRLQMAPTSGTSIESLKTIVVGSHSNLPYLESRESQALKSYDARQSHLENALIENLRKRGSRPGEHKGESNGIDVGVFVIKRTGV